MRLFIKYDSNGEILSVAKIEFMPEEMPHPFIDDPEANVMEVPIDSKLEKLECSAIHDGYMVNVETKKLKKLN